MLSPVPSALSEDAEEGNLNRRRPRVCENESCSPTRALHRKAAVAGAVPEVDMASSCLCQPNPVTGQSFPQKSNLGTEAITDLEGSAAGTCCRSVLTGAGLLQREIGAKSFVPITLI